jgi:hypothetical protein
MDAVFALRELQCAFADAILSRDIASFANRVRSNRLSGAERMQLYQNNVFISLTQALADVYPVVERLVGNEFFRFMARRFIQGHPSRSGNLHDFGRELPTFLRGLCEARDLPYLGDVAALEWAYHEVFHAGDAPPLDFTQLAQVSAEAQDRLHFRLHPATRLVASRYPILAIWEANQGDEPPQTTIDLDVGADYLIVARRDPDRMIERLAPGEFSFLAEVGAGATLAQACEAALAADPEIDIGTTMGRFVAQRTIAGSIALDP